MVQSKLSEHRVLLKHDVKKVKEYDLWLCINIWSMFRKINKGLENL